MKSIDELLDENPHLLTAVSLLLKSVKKHDFNTIYKWDDLREKDSKRIVDNFSKYFIDYSEDKILPSRGEVSLVQCYFDRMIENDTPIECFTTNEDMLSEISYLASFAKNGIADLKTFTNKELLEKIEKVGKF